MITDTKLFGRQIGYEYNQQYATSSLASARDHMWRDGAVAAICPRLSRRVTRACTGVRLGHTGAARARCRRCRAISSGDDRSSRRYRASRQETTGAVGNVGPSRRETTAAAGGVGPSRQETMGAVGAPHAPKPLLQLVVCARSPGTTRATAVREVHLLIDQSVRNDVVLPVDVRHRPVNAPLRKRVADLGACAEVRPQCRGAAGGFPAAEDDHLACDQL